MSNGLGGLQVRVAGEDKEDVEKAMKQLEKAQQLLDDVREAIQALEEFYDESKKKWSKLSQCVLGYIAHSYHSWCWHQRVY
jgi:flagellar motility protein MotE (MotC chaperone)